MKALAQQIADIDGINIYGRVVGVRGLMVEIGRSDSRDVGRFPHCGRDRRRPFHPLRGDRLLRQQCGGDAVRWGWTACGVAAARSSPTLPTRCGRPQAWLGRVINAMGEPIDGKGAVAARRLADAVPQFAAAGAFAQSASASRSTSAVRSLNTFLTCCRGQRMGIFAGSGVGKSVLLSMLARNVAADVTVIGLVGERGREVQEFLQDDLGEKGLARSVVVVATSDEPAPDAAAGGLSDACHRRVFPRRKQIGCCA